MLALVIACTLYAQVGSAGAPTDARVGVAYTNGGVIIRSLDGSVTKQATAAEKALYSAIRVSLPATSPDGMYKVALTERSDEPRMELFDVNGKPLGIRLPEDLPSYDFPGGQIVGWGPVKGTIVFECSSKSENKFLRIIGRPDIPLLLPFSGWYSPSKKMGITPPSLQYVVDRGLARDTKASKGTYYEGIEQNLYAVHLPNDLMTYDFASSKKTLLTLGGRPFHCTFPHTSSLVDGKITYRYGVEFSPGEGWAIIDERYLVNLVTGAVEQIRGDGARFLTLSKALKPVRKKATAQSKKPAVKPTVSQNKLSALIDTGFEKGEMQVAWSYQGGRLAVSDGTPNVCLFETTTWTRCDLKAAGPIHELRFSANGATLAALCGTSSNKVTFFEVDADLQRSRLAQTYYMSDRLRREVQTPMAAFAVNGSGQISLLAYSDGQVEQCPTMVATTIGMWKLDGVAKMMAYSRDRRFFYVLTSKGRWQKWDSKLDCKIVDEELPVEGLQAAVLLADEQCVGLLLGSEARVVTLPTKESKSIKLPADAKAPTFTQDARKLVYAVGKEVIVVDILTGKTVGTYDLGFPVLAIGISEDPTQIAAVLQNGKVRILYLRQ
jgi:hypothetical protein